jgi:penicillin-binding protein 1B
MSAKSSPAKRNSPKVKKRHQRSLVFLLVQILIIVFCTTSIWLLWLDHRIQEEFEGKRWSLPARVYASATEIYLGQNLSISEFEKALSAVGYHKESKAISSGQYERNKGSIDLVKRSFVFWDGEEKSLNLRVSFSQGKVSSIQVLPDERSLGLFRLEPQLIGKIYPQHNEDRVVLPYDEVPSRLIDALIAVEDRHFFSHAGLDFRGIARAIYINLRQGRLSQGGSTLTQQLVKNFFLTHERTYWRKFNEVVISLVLERRYSKAEILHAYINEIYLGQHGVRAIHGFGTASEYYFSKPLKELNIEQLALLVGLVKGASYYNPYRHPQRSLKRRNLVLQLLQNQNQAEAALLKIAQSKPLGLANKPTWTRAKYPAFLDLVKRQLLREYKIDDLRNEGLRIFTTLRPEIQDKMEVAVERELKALEKQKQFQTGRLETAVVVTNVSSGEVLGLIGGRQRDKISFNRAIDAKRPIGSLIKPVIYYTALSRPSEFNLLSQLDDSAVSIRQNDSSFWQPRNYDRKAHENVTLIDALSHSYNQATVRLGLQLGLDKIIGVLHQMGFDENINAYPSLLLGAIEMSSLEVAQMYQSFANGGFQVPNNSIREVLNKDGSAIQRYSLEMNQVLQPAPVFLTNFLLTQVVETGTARGLLNMIPGLLPLAGKTGTTNELRDSWFSGFGDKLLGVVWVGQDNNESTRLTGASGAMRVWAEMMKSINIEPLNLLAPEDIDWLSSAGNRCHKLQLIPFVQGHKPGQSLCE